MKLRTRIGIMIGTLYLLFVGMLFAYSTDAATCLQGYGGGTGICVATSSDVGKVLTVSTTFHGTPVYYFSNVSSSGGGSTTTFNGISTSTLTIACGAGCVVATSTDGTGQAIVTITPNGGSGSSTVLYAGNGIILTPNPINTTGTVAVNTSTAFTWSGIHTFSSGLTSNSTTNVLAPLNVGTTTSQATLTVQSTSTLNNSFVTQFFNSNGKWVARAGGFSGTVEGLELNQDDGGTNGPYVNLYVGSTLAAALGMFNGDAYFYTTGSTAHNFRIHANGTGNVIIGSGSASNLVEIRDAAQLDQNTSTPLLGTDSNGKVINVSTSTLKGWTDTFGYLTGNQSITLSGDVTGSGATTISTTVGKVQGVAVTSTAPTDHKILAYLGANADWEPLALNAGTAINIATSSSGFTINNTGVTSVNYNGGGAASGTLTINAVASINGDTTAAQKITSDGTITTSTSSGVTTLGVKVANNTIATSTSGISVNTSTLGLQPTLSFPLAYGSTTHSGAGAYLGFSGNNLTVSSTLASSSLAFNFYTPTTTAGYNLAYQISPNKKTITSIDCADQTATTTISVYYATSTANAAGNLPAQTILASLVCGTAGNSTTTFTTSTLPALDYLMVNVSSTVGTPTHATVNIQATKQ